MQFPSATVVSWVFHTNAAFPLSWWMYIVHPGWQGHMEHCLPGTPPCLTAHSPWPVSSSPSQRSDYWPSIQLLQRLKDTKGPRGPPHVNSVRLSSGRSPRQTRTFLSARIFLGPRDHVLVAKSKEQEDSHYTPRSLNKELSALIPIPCLSVKFPFYTHSGSDGIALPFEVALSNISLKL